MLDIAMSDQHHVVEFVVNQIDVVDLHIASSP